MSHYTIPCISRTRSAGADTGNSDIPATVSLHSGIGASHEEGPARFRCSGIDGNIPAAGIDGNAVYLYANTVITAISCRKSAGGY